MASEWYLMRNTTLGGFETEELAWQKSAFVNDVLLTPLAKTIWLYGTKISNTPSEHRVLIQDTTADTQMKADLRTILCKIGTLSCGDYVFVNGQWWLVISLVDNNTVYEKGVLQYCKYIVRFIVPGTLKVVEYPVTTINSTQYNSGEENRSHITIGIGQRLIFIPCNEETICIDNDFRILMDKNTANPTAWRVSQVDAESYAYGAAGLIRWTMVESGLQDTDDILHMLADNTAYDKMHSSQTVANAEGWGL